MQPFKTFEYQSFAHKQGEGYEYNENRFFNELGASGWEINDLKGFRLATTLTDSSGQPVFHYGVVALCKREEGQEGVPASLLENPDSVVSQ